MAFSMGFCRWDSLAKASKTMEKKKHRFWLPENRLGGMKTFDFHSVVGFSMFLEIPNT